MEKGICRNNVTICKYLDPRTTWKVISGDMNAPVFIGIIILACLFGIDIATTSIGLSLGASEANNIMVRFVGTPFTHFIVKWFVVVLMAITVRWCDEIIPGVGLNFLAVLIGWYSFTVANNIHVIMSLMP